MLAQNLATLALEHGYTVRFTTTRRAPPKQTTPRATTFHQSATGIRS